MDAAWKVYVGDRRFDDNQISNLFLKLKYETVGRFTFDFRPIDGDESYMVVGNTLRIFWGDLHRLDGVIQRVDWDDTLYCYHVFGADIRGFLLDRVNTEPATVSSYTSDIQTQVQYTGCDFPSNVWTGAGDKIGTYTFHYKLGIQNTIRITTATQNIWHNIVERGTVYDHVGGCLYDATKNWEVNKYRGATLRFVSGACKNNVYNVNGNTANRVCIRLPGETAEQYATRGSDWASPRDIDGVSCGNIVYNPSFDQDALRTIPQHLPLVGESGEWVCADLAPQWNLNATYTLSEDCVSPPKSLSWTMTWYYDPFWTYRIAACRVDSPSPWVLGPGTAHFRFWAKKGSARDCAVFIDARFFGTEGTNYYEYITERVWLTDEWACYEATQYATHNLDPVDHWEIGISQDIHGGNYAKDAKYYIDDLTIYVPGFTFGTIPGCSRIGDIYEIVTATMERIDPAPLAPATLEKDNHIVNFNVVEDLSDHITSVVVQGINALADVVDTYTEGWHWPW